MVVSLTGRVNPWCDSRDIKLHTASSYFSCWNGGSTELPSNKLLVLQKKEKSLPNLNCVTLLSISQPQFNMRGVLLPSSHTTAQLLACGNVLAWQMSRPSLASRCGSLLSTSTKELASFHLCPNTGLDLFFRNDTVMIYFSGPSGKVPRWETAFVVMLYSGLCCIQSYAIFRVMLIQTISLVSLETTPATELVASALASGRAGCTWARRKVTKNNWSLHRATSRFHKGNVFLPV